MDFDRHDESQGVDEEVTLTATDFLSTVVAAWSTGFGRFHRLAVDDRGTGGRWVTLTLTDELSQGGVECLPDTMNSPQTVIVVDRLPWREVVWP
ncbi:hypothetical protein GCM10010842_38520 [Deinococcus daejeonensis]|uniref:Uncharacterized protein n=1 Tax=Deinococcus daejeonensis TaxID=1007098 RepID=A0ABQ2JKT8_9DEIO|nr:hypothetical protein GCM10010842_38520 [Deinococcus daejeonensis]